jgi:hypothetical protein
LRKTSEQYLTRQGAAKQLQLPFLAPCELFATIFTAVHLQLKPRTPLPSIRVEFFPFAGINHTARLNQGKLSIRISDLFEDAPGDVSHALALILLSKLYRKKIDASVHRIYRAFILRTDIQERARVARSDRGRGARISNARGRHFDLEVLFDRMNREYFGGVLDKPRISWSAKKSRYILGRYDSTHHTIFISRLFDSERVPSYVVEYVMYHEMLHVRHHTRVRDCRLIVHSPEFKQEERQFARFEEAKNWLRTI